MWTHPQFWVRYPNVNDHFLFKACLYFTACYDESKLDSTSRMLPDLTSKRLSYSTVTRFQMIISNETISYLVWPSLKGAVERKHTCNTFGVISTLSIEYVHARNPGIHINNIALSRPISSSKCNFSLETDQKNFVFAFGEDSQKLLEFKANDDTTVNINGKSHSMEVYQ